MVELTKYGIEGFYRVPPESTGARMAHNQYWYFYVTGLESHTVGQSTFTLGTSGVFGRMHSMQEFETGTRILVTLHEDSELSGFVADEVFTMVHADGSTHAGVLKQWEQVLMAQTTLADANNPQNYISIDERGAASMRFTEGEPLFDAYGMLRVVEPQPIATYVFRYDAHSAMWQEKTTGTADVVHLPERSSIALDCDTGATDSVSYTTNKHYRSVPGVAHMAMMSLAVGDSGKANVKRRWGLYNDRNGVFFELDGTNLYCCLRSDVTGSVVDTRVGQSSWSDDQVDGEGGSTNKSGMDLDPAKHNIYWLDFQWRGGIVRFGTYTSAGRRITVHTSEHANISLTPYFGTAALPLRVEQSNTAASASPSRLSLSSASLFREGELLEDTKDNNATARSWSMPAGFTADGTEKLVACFRSGSLVGTMENRKLIVPRFFNYLVTGEPVQVIFRANTVLSSGTWASAAMASGAEVCLDGVSAFAGIQVSATYITPGAARHAVSEVYNGLSNALHTMADGTPGVVFSMWVKSLGTSSDFFSSIDWIEV